MVSTRHSTPKRTKKAAAKASTEEEEWALLASQAQQAIDGQKQKKSEGTVSKKKTKDDDAVSVEEMAPPKKSVAFESSAKKTTSSKKKKTKRQQEKEELRSKNTGVGLKISIGGSGAKENANKGKKKIVFDEASLPPPEKNEQENEQLQESTDASQGDDDAIEEVPGSKAREHFESLMATEEREAAKATKKKRKRKERLPKEQPKDDIVDEADLDDEFFSQLENVRQAEAEEQRKVAKAAAKAATKGKHTTFVFSQEVDDDSKASRSAPVKVGGNIEVVVLGTKSPSHSAGAGATAGEISEEAMMYSRSLLKDGSDSAIFGERLFGGGNRDSKKRKLAAGETETWKRSKKGSTIRRRLGGKGLPALLFSKKKR
jgi:hypothetical protein